MKQKAAGSKSKRRVQKLRRSTAALALVLTPRGWPRHGIPARERGAVHVVELLRERLLGQQWCSRIESVGGVERPRLRSPDSSQLQEHDGVYAMAVRSDLAVPHRYVVLDVQQRIHLCKGPDRVLRADVMTRRFLLATATLSLVACSDASPEQAASVRDRFAAYVSGELTSDEAVKLESEIFLKVQDEIVACMSSAGFAYIPSSPTGYISAPTDISNRSWVNDSRLRDLHRRGARADSFGPQRRIPRVALERRSHSVPDGVERARRESRMRRRAPTRLSTPSSVSTT